ncbi:MAG: hypothetical protein ACE5HC_16980 [Candidatus Binatia bacterium]
MNGIVVRIYKDTHVAGNRVSHEVVVEGQDLTRLLLVHRAFFWLYAGIKGAGHPVVLGNNLLDWIIGSLIPHRHVGFSSYLVLEIFTGMKWAGLRRKRVTGGKKQHPRARTPPEPGLPLRSLIYHWRVLEPPMLGRILDRQDLLTDGVELDTLGRSDVSPEWYKSRWDRWFSFVEYQLPFQ